MNEPESLEPTTHQQTTLLPWYLVDTLDPQERLEVEAHLSRCESCQMELDEMKRTRAALKAAASEREGPSPAVLTKVMARIREEKASSQSATASVPQKTPGVFAKIEARIQSLFAVPWVPVLATILIVGQSALLLTNLGEQPGSLDRGPVLERGIPQASAPSKSSQLHIVFAETATQGEIQSLLKQIHAQIVSGPSLEGSYILEIPTNNRAEIQNSLQALRTQPNIIRTAKSAIP